jgi:hypothetical protein
VGARGAFGGGGKSGGTTGARGAGGGALVGESWVMVGSR